MVDRHEQLKFEAKKEVDSFIESVSVTCPSLEQEALQQAKIDYLLNKVATLRHSIEYRDKALDEYFGSSETACGKASEYDDSMDGDHQSALASAGMGTDEDYGGGDERL